MSEQAKNADRPQEFVRVAGSKQTPIPLFAPESRRGQCPSFSGALPAYGAEMRGVVAAVGFPKAYLVYRFHFDDRSGQGSWAFCYSVENGELAHGS